MRDLGLSGRLGLGGCSEAASEDVLFRTDSQGLPEGPGALAQAGKLLQAACEGFPCVASWSLGGFHFAQCQGPAEQRSQLLCSVTLTGKGRGSWRCASNCLRGQRKGEAVELEGGVRKKAVMGWQDARDSWGIKTGRRGRGSEGLWGGSNQATETRRKPRFVTESGPERQVKWNGFSTEMYFLIWV